MAITGTASNHVKYQIGKKEIDLSSDTIIAVLMDTTFSFSPDSHPTLASITANQLATKNGYTQDNKALTSVVFTEDDTNDKATLSCDDITWTATEDDDSTGIGPTGSMCFVDTDTSDDTVICCIDFDADYPIASGSSIQFKNITISLT